MGPKLQSQGVTEVEEVIEEESTENEGVESDEPKESESVEESARQAFKELQEQANADGGEGEEESAPEPESGSASEPVQEQIAKPEKPTFKGKKVIEAEDLEPEQGTEAHHRFKPHIREMFNKMQNKALKRGINQSVEELEATMTRTTQAAAAREREASGLVEAIKPYIDSATDLNLPVPQFVAKLCLAHKRLIDDSTKDEQFINIGEGAKPSLKAYQLLGQKLGYSSGNGGNDEGQASGNVDISNHPVVRQLTDQINSLQEKLNPIYNQNKQTTEAQANEVYENTRNELLSVYEEADSQGNYVRPELIQNPEFLERWKRQTTALMGDAKFGTSWAQAGRNAYRVLKGQAPMGSTQINPSRNPTANNNNNRNRVASNVISVRGRSSPSTSELIEKVDAPSNETPLQSAMAALAELQGRG